MSRELAKAIKDASTFTATEEVAREKKIIDTVTLDTQVNQNERHSGYIESVVYDEDHSIFTINFRTTTGETKSQPYLLSGVKPITDSRGNIKVSADELVRATFGRLCALVDMPTPSLAEVQSNAKKFKLEMKLEKELKKIEGLECIMFEICRAEYNEELKRRTRVRYKSLFMPFFTVYQTLEDKLETEKVINKAIKADGCYQGEIVDRKSGRMIPISVNMGTRKTNLVMHGEYGRVVKVAAIQDFNIKA